MNWTVINVNFSLPLKICIIPTLKLLTSNNTHAIILLSFWIYRNMKVVINLKMDNDTKQAISIFKALGEENRMKITKILVTENNLCCTEISGELESIAGSTLSHHLKILTDCGILSTYKKGTYKYYQVDHELLKRFAPFVLE
ncbi:ArsR/SmtB family transcription factor [Lysinibacillus pakistanensis]|uniref:ArsR/SmtB family transcription factor n=1 Tax=Lysinibacillus pakistanensis TaxID=759811 RepID=UPI003D27E710